MRPFNDLDEAIDAHERGIATRRHNLKDALRESEEGLRCSVASPKVIIGTVLAGFLVGRMLDRSRADPVAVGKTVGIAGVLGGLAISLLRAQLGTPGSWINEMLVRRMRATAPTPDPYARDMPGQDTRSGGAPRADEPANTMTRPPNNSRSDGVGREPFV